MTKLDTMENERRDHPTRWGAHTDKDASTRVTWATAPDADYSFIYVSVLTLTVAPHPSYAPLPFLSCTSYPPA